MKTRTNKIGQKMEIQVQSADAEFGVLIDFLKKFVQDKTHQTIEGQISRLSIVSNCGYGSSADTIDSFELNISTVKEDRVKMLEFK